MTKIVDKIPSGSLKDKWTNYKNNIRLVNPANKRLKDRFGKGVRRRLLCRGKILMENN